jgi:hypothetical protein
MPFAPHTILTHYLKTRPSAGVDILKPRQLEEETFTNIKYTLECCRAKWILRSPYLKVGSDRPRSPHELGDP